ncbi:MAG: DUF6544 family protein [Burkholderiales bacterium]
MNRSTWAATAIGSVVLAGAGLSAIGKRRWSLSTHALHARLAAAQSPPIAARHDRRELEGLPAPVQRYFNAVLEEGQPIVRSVALEQTGSMNLSQTGEQWRPFTAQQSVTTRTPGFVWNARIKFMPGIAVLVHDSYIARVGILEASVMGVLSLADQQGSGDLARGELIRYFAEAAWYPTALLPSQGVQWSAVDEHTADATLVDGPFSVTMRVGFDATGLIRSSRFEARGMAVGDRSVSMPWEGCWSDYAKRGGMRVPMSGEAAWLLPRGRKPYWRGAVTSIQFSP